MPNWPRTKPKAFPVSQHSRTIPKFESMKTIVSTGSFRKAEELQKFEIDEEVSVEIPVRESQKSKPRINNQAKALASKGTKKLGMFNCDSISIRPNSNNTLNPHIGIVSQSNNNNSMNGSTNQILTHSILKANCTKSNTVSLDHSHNGNTKQSQNLTDGKLDSKINAINDSDQSILELLQGKESSNETSSAESKENRRCLKLKNSLKKRRHQIFTNQPLLDNQKESMPECYLLDGYHGADPVQARHRKIFNHNSDQLFRGRREVTYHKADSDVEFHIVFEADEILQCCL